MFHRYKTITSIHNDDYKALNRLLMYTRARRKQGVIVVEGIHLAQACVDHAVQIFGVYINECALQHEEVIGLIERWNDDNIPIRIMPNALIAQTTTLASPPEVIAVCARPMSPPIQPDSSRVLLERIQDPGNLGTILRAAAASGIDDIFVGKGCADVYAPKVLRSGMGAHFSLAIHEESDLVAILERYPGKRLVTRLDGDSSLYSQDLTGPVAFVFGNEGAGVSAALSTVADVRVRIPMPGCVESLNVAMAATLCLFERVRQCEVR